MTKNPTDKELIEFTRFVATKFGSDHKPWVYSRDLGDLVHIRYKTDSTGYNHWTKRVKRAFDPRALFETKHFGARTGLTHEKLTLKERFLYAYVHLYLALRKDSHLPDGQIDGNLVHWEEHGEYITMMGPTVGVKVLDFLEAEPDNDHAKSILAAMREAYNASWEKDQK